MKTIRYVLCAAILILFPTVSAHAQGGCVNSPEAPTAVLGLIGSAAALFSVAKNTYMRQTASRNQRRK